MTKTPLFKYTGKNGDLITPIDLGIEYEPMFRLVADINHYLTDGNITTTAVDVTSDEVDLWTEVEYDDDSNIPVIESGSNNEEVESNG